MTFVYTGIDIDTFWTTGEKIGQLSRDLIGRLQLSRDVIGNETRNFIGSFRSIYGPS